MKRVMTEKEKKLVEENHNVIYGVLQKMNLSIDEYYDVAAISLCKAAMKFDETKGCKFSTYAYFVISNDIKMVFRKNTMSKSIPKDCLTYYQTEISNNDGKSTELLDLIPDKVNVESEVLANVTVDDLLQNRLKERDILICNLFMLGYKQNEISRIVGLSQSQISRTKTKIIKLLKEG